MGAVEEGGKVAHGVVQSLKDQPLVLAVVVLNVLFLLFLVWTFHVISGRNERKDNQLDTVIQELEKSCAKSNPTNWLEPELDAKH